MNVFAFENRRDAGEKLGRALEAYRGAGAIVLAIPRGGVEVAFHAARYIGAPLSIIVARKLPLPGNPEAGFGAVSEDGSAFVFDDIEGWLAPEEIARVIEAQKEEIRRRIQAFRGGEPLPDLAGRTVILVDDGIAMGSTMRVAIMTCRNRGAGAVIVAAPVAGRSVRRDLGDSADEIVVLEQPPHFQAVAQAYREWYDVPDGEVVALMARWRREMKGA
jgi:predicted phosphoribosyltransferase